MNDNTAALTRNRSGSETYFSIVSANPTTCVLLPIAYEVFHKRKKKNCEAPFNALVLIAISPGASNSEPGSSRVDLDSI